jgi:hypothetical protein
MEKFDIFLEVAEKLNKSFSVKPILYGSLGLSVLLEENIRVNDIDVLVPTELITSKWENFKDVMKECGFELKNLKEHEFVRNGEIMAFASDEALGDVDLTANDLIERIERGIVFKGLTPEQYLKVYQYTLHDGYRLTKHSDQEKIGLLEEYLNNRKK